MFDHARFSPLRHRIAILCISLLILTAAPACTRDEVAGAVSTIVFDLQSTLEPANLTATVIREDGSTALAATTPAIAAVATVLEPSPTIAVVEPITQDATVEPAAPPVEQATDQPTQEPAAPSTATPTLIPSPIPSPTVAPTALPSPTPFTERIMLEGSDMLFVPGSFFKRGADSGELLAECDAFRPGCQAGWFAASEPAHTVLVAPFYIDEHEVTNLAFVTFLNNEAAGEANDCGAGPCLDFEQTVITQTTSAGFQVEADLATHPVAGVTWYGATAFCESRGARLPTESEWEKAALWNPATEDKTRYPWGDAFDGTLVNFCDATCQEEQRNADFDDGYATTAPVASYENGRSYIGAYDMAGNVWEWVSDWYAEDAYEAMETINPVGPAEGTARVVRGGSWFDTGNFTSGLIRFPSPPENADRTIGFRCAISAP